MGKGGGWLGDDGRMLGWLDWKTMMDRRSKFLLLVKLV